jgi:hypothetical protein
VQGQRGAVGPEGPQGETGDTGPVGPPGGTAYVHTQTVPASTWIIDHNLGRRVHVSLSDAVAAPFRLVYSDVDHGSLNQTTVTFPTPTAGSAVLS